MASLKQVASRIQNLPQFLKKYRKQSLLIFLVLSGIFISGLRNFRLDQSMEAFFDKNDPTMVRFQWFKYVFGSDEFIMVMYHPKDNDVFSTKSLAALQELENNINAKRLDPKSQLSRITRVRSLISADFLESQANSLINRPFIERLPQNPAESEALRQAALKHRDYPESFFSRDSQYGVILMLTDFGARVAEKPEEEEIGDEFDFSDEGNEVISLDQVPTLEEIAMDAYTPVVTELEAVFKASPKWQSHTQASHFIGNPILMTFFDRVILKEISLFSGLSILIILFVMLIAFRSFTAIVWPSLILITAMLWTIGCIGLTGIEMTFMVNIIIFLLLAVSMASSIHILSGYNYAQADGADPDTALKKTYYKSGLPIILAALTTAIGLLSLLFVPIPAIRTFGAFAAIGVLFALCLNLFLWPILMSFWAPKVKAYEIKKTFLGKFLAGQIERALHYKVLIISIFSGLAIFFGIGLSKVHIDTNFIAMIKEGYGFTESYRIVDKFFGGTATVDVLIDTGKQDGTKNSQLLKNISAYIEAVRQRYPELVTRGTSLVNVTKDSYQNLSADSKNYKIPNDDNTVAQVLMSFESADPSNRRLLVDDNWQVARLTFSVLTTGTGVYEKFLDDLKSMAPQYFKEPLKVYYTGGVQLMTQLLNLVSISQIRSFSLALAVITIVLFLLFSSLKFGLLAMIPNIFPIITVMGTAGWLGIPLDSDTLLVMPIAIGIAVDDTIHFLTHYKSEIADGLDVKGALDSALRKVGQAITFTTVVLSSGFLIFVLSAYKPLTHFGILSAIAISTALVADLFLLPILVKLMHRQAHEPSIPTHAPEHS